MSQLQTIKRLYYRTSRTTVQRYLERAIELLTSMSSEQERARAAVFMDGLSQMRSEWALEDKAKRRGTARHAYKKR